MKILFCITLLIILCVPLLIKGQVKQMDISNIKPSPDPLTPSRAYIPKNLNDCFVELKKILPAQFLEKLKNADNSEVSDEAVNLAGWIVINWKFQEGTDLVRYFDGYLMLSKKYIDDSEVPAELVYRIILPDEVSRFIVNALRLHLNGELKDVEKYLQLIKRWSVAELPPTNDELIFARCKDGVQLEGRIVGDSEENPQVIHYGRCETDNKLWAYERGKGWYLPNAKLTKQIAEFDVFPKLKRTQETVDTFSPDKKN
jgi:hypothetical protein